MTFDLSTAIVIAAAAGLMRGFAGVGSGMLMAPFFVHKYGPVQTVGVIILIEIVATALLLPSVRREIQWRTIGPMGLAAAVFMPIGSWLLISIETSILQFGVSLLVTVSALLLMTGWRYGGAKPISASIGVGVISGLLMALTSLGNPPVMLYLLSSRDSAATNRANFTGYFALTLIALIATWIGVSLFRKSDEKFYRQVALCILLVAGLYGMSR